MSSPSIYEPLPQLDRRWHQPCVGESEWSDDTTVASMASWPPPNKVNPSATTSRRRKSLLCGDAILTVDTLGFVLPRYLSDATLCCKNPPAQKPSCAARCSVVAKSVEWTATPAGAYNERQGGQTETAEQQHAEWLGIQLGHAVDWHSGEKDGTQWATLRSHQSPLDGRQSGPHHIDVVVFVHRL